MSQKTTKEPSTGRFSMIKFVATKAAFDIFFEFIKNRFPELGWLFPSAVFDEIPADVGDENSKPEWATYVTTGFEGGAF